MTRKVVLMKKSIPTATHEGERECVHCLGSGWMLDSVETSLGEFEDVSYLCVCRKSDDGPDKIVVLGISEARARRIKRGVAIYADHGSEIEWVRGDVYLVPSMSRGIKHEVDLGAGTCTCEDSSLGGFECAHQIAASVHQAKALTKLRREAERRPVNRWEPQDLQSIEENIARLEGMLA